MSCHGWKPRLPPATVMVPIGHSARGSSAVADDHVDEKHGDVDDDQRACYGRDGVEHC
jgi:hypothetical protein